MKARPFLLDTRGASVVEFALLIAPFLLLVIGVIEVSRAFWTRQALHDVAAATARCIGVGQDECTVNGVYDPAKSEAFARDQARSRAIVLAADAVTIARGLECDGIASAVAAELAADFDSVFPFEIVIDFDVRACFLDWSAL